MATGISIREQYGRTPSLWPSADIRNDGVAPIPFRRWDGTLEGLDAAERTALGELRLLLVWHPGRPGWATRGPGDEAVWAEPPIFSGLVRGTFVTGLLRVVRERSWEVSPPSRLWPGPNKQVRRRPLKVFSPNDVAYWTSSQFNIEEPVWPMAFTGVMPAEAIWVETLPTPRPVETFRDLAGGIHTYPWAYYVPMGESYRLPWLLQVGRSPLLLHHDHVTSLSVVDGARFIHPLTGVRSTFHYNPAGTAPIPDSAERRD